MFVLDSHCDTPSQLIRLRKLDKDGSHSHVDFPKLRRGGVDAVFFALFTPNTMVADAATRYALQMLEAVYESVGENPDMAAMAFSPDDAFRNKGNGLTSVFLGMENGLPIQHDLSLLRLFHRMGVRYMTLCHNGDNEICDSAAGNARWGGLSGFGREVVAEMNRLGMLVDIAHASDKTFYDCLEASSVPIVSTHSCCRALASHRRNLSDPMLRALADKGGVVQVNFYPLFLSDSFAHTLAQSGLEEEADRAEAAFIASPSDPDAVRTWENAQDMLKSLPRPGVKEIVDHIDHAVNVAGIDHVGIGSDFDGINVPPLGLEDISMIGRLFDQMTIRGYSDDQIEKVAGLNFIRVFNEALRA